MAILDFAPAADDEWAFILDHDRKLAEIIDPLLDRIESGELAGGMFANRVRFVTFRVPGRDDLYTIVWEVQGEHRTVHRIGKRDTA